MSASPLPLRPIFLLTDFGTNDWYVGAMKGEILRVTPNATIVDLCHGIAPQDIAAGAFVLRAALKSVPTSSVLCCVVDPGVGSQRRALWGRIGKFYFSGPDNGIATPLMERAGDVELYELSRSIFNIADPSPTFHGRDLFAPAAALLAQGLPYNEFHRPVTDPVRVANLDPEETAEGIRARIMLVDRFGNLITNVWREKYEHKLGENPKITLGPLTITKISNTFSDVEPGTPLAYWGSAGTLEIAVNQKSAAQATALTAGDFISLLS